MYKKTLEKHNTIIKELDTKIAIDKERQDYLLAYDSQLKKEMNELKFELHELKSRLLSLKKEGKQ